MESRGTVMDVGEPCVTNSTVGTFPLSGLEEEQILTVDANMVVKIEEEGSANPVNSACQEKQKTQILLNSNMDPKENIDLKPEEKTIVSQDFCKAPKEEQIITVDENMVVKIEQEGSENPVNAACQEKQKTQTLNANMDPKENIELNPKENIDLNPKEETVVSQDFCKTTSPKRRRAKRAAESNINLDTRVKIDKRILKNTENPTSNVKQIKTSNSNVELRVSTRSSRNGRAHEEQEEKTSSNSNVEPRVSTRSSRNGRAHEEQEEKTSSNSNVELRVSTRSSRNARAHEEEDEEKTSSKTDVDLDLKMEEDGSGDRENSTTRTDSEYSSDTTDVESLDELYVTFKEKPGAEADASPNDSDEDYDPSNQREMTSGSGDFVKGKRRSRRICRRQQKIVKRKIKKPQVIKVSDTKYKCSSCSETFSSSKEVTKHIPNHFNIQCEDCSETFQSHRKMLSHKNKMHQKYKCSVVGCEYEANKKAMLRRHFNYDHKSYSCSYCSFTAPRKSDIQTHSQVNHKGQPPQLTKVQLCHVCGAEFNNSHTYHQHVLNHHGIQMKNCPVKVCEVCSEEFMDRFSLRHHVYLMHMEKQVKCKFPNCNSCFKIKAQMESHYRVVHLGSLNLNCPYEGCSYSSRQHHIKKHINMVHLKIRSHPCLWPECGKLFYDKHHLAVHMLMHTGSKPMSCEICDYRCRQRAALTWHMKKKHPDQCLDTFDKKTSTAAIEWPEQNLPVGVPTVSRAHKPGRKGRR